MAKYGREVIDRVRVDRGQPTARRPAGPAGGQGRALAAAAEPRATLDPREDRVRARGTAGGQPAAVHGLRAQGRPEEALGLPRTPATRGASGRTGTAGHPQPHRAAEALRPRPQARTCHGILAHCRWPLRTNLLEGINNKIKVIKRMAYGFRDDDYFFLKIRAAFPGNPG